jgi:FtsP/CotA-like multicopper oxidase with cupredoxin domain
MSDRFHPLQIERHFMPLASTRRAFLAGVSAFVVPLPALGEPAPRILEARAGRTRLLPEPAEATDILGFADASNRPPGVLRTPYGPLLRYKQGDTLTARLVNKTDLPMSLHWQGMRGDNAMDGVVPLTQTPVPPGASFDYRRAVNDPGLFCYRPSVFPRTGELMGRGLKGLVVVDEATPLGGDADLAVMLDDWRLDAKAAADGDFANPAEARGAGRIGTLLTVNGAGAPETHEFAPGARARLRLANLANARIMVLSFEGVKPYVIAIDSQPCDAFVPVRQTIPVAPGARFELMFDMPAAGATARVILRGAEGRDQDLLRFVAKGESMKGDAAPSRPAIQSLPQNPLLPREIKLAESKKIDLAIAQDGGVWTLNGAVSKAYGGDPLFRVKRGTPVTLGFDNRSGVPLVMHAHGHAMRLLHDLDDGWEPYWRNAIVAPPGKVKHVAFVADSPGKWALHDDILEHEAAGVSTWFEVT